jgi:integrase
MPKRHLTDLSIQRLRPPARGSVEHFDRGYNGLALRVGHGGAKSFVLLYRHGAKLRRVTLGRWPEVSLAAAREAWRSTREAIARGEDPRHAVGRSRLFEAVVEEWLRRDVAPRSRASTAYQISRIVEHDLIPALGGRSIGDIKKHDILVLLDSICDRGAPMKAHRVYAQLRRLFQWAEGRDLITTSPLKGLEPPTPCRPRERVLSDDELARVWGAAGADPYGALVKLLVLTGARRNEVGRLTWDEVAGDVIRLEGARTKNRRAHLIPLSKPALAVVETLPRIRGAFVFSLDGERPVSISSQAKRRLDRASGVTNWCLHDIRRSVATGMQRLGVGLQTVEALLGHVSGSRSGIVGVYQKHDFWGERRAAVEAWGEYVTALVR